MTSGYTQTLTISAAVPYYQPETAYQIFNRVMFSNDVATGSQSNVQLSTVGPSSAWTASPLPPPEAEPQCYLWDILETCTPAQKQILKNGTAVVKDFVLVGFKQNGQEVLFSQGGSGNGTTSGAGGQGTKGGKPNGAGRAGVGFGVMIGAVFAAAQVLL